MNYLLHESWSIFWYICYAGRGGGGGSSEEYLVSQLCEARVGRRMYEVIRLGGSDMKEKYFRKTTSE